MERLTVRGNTMSFNVDVTTRVIIYLVTGLQFQANKNIILEKVKLVGDCV